MALRQAGSFVSTKRRKERPSNQATNNQSLKAMNKQFTIKSVNVAKFINKIAAKAETATQLNFLAGPECCSQWDLSEPTKPKFTAVTR